MKQKPNTTGHIYCMLFFIFNILWAGTAFGQPVYMMQNALVTDCEGILLDSEMGPEEGQYNHNEDYTFTICVDGADEIVLTFDFFATEENYDVLTIHDGLDTNYPILAELEGTIQPPPVIVGSGSCITLHFTSDDNIVASGWSLHWEVSVDEPEIPDLSMESIPDCPMSIATFSFDRRIDCDLFSIDNFSVIGPGNTTISEINLLDCAPNSNLGSTFEVVFEEPLSREGNYRLLFDGEIQDACGEWHEVSTNISFTLDNCPIDVDIELVDAACAGECGRVRAVVTGSSGNNFDYQWSHTGQNSDVVEVCTNDSLDISVTVTNISNGETATDEYTYVSLENPEFLNPLSGDTICSSSGDHFYNMSMGGGEFYSELIPGGERRSGRYQFWRWSWRNNIDRDTIYYVAPNGCAARDTVFISPVWAGPLTAACQNSGSFQLDSETPAGGSWSGPHVSSDGIFTPAEEGSFVVAYTSVYGCTDWRRINVRDGIDMPDVDTICSYNPFNFEAEPYGGRWSGPGIVNAVNGRCEPYNLEWDTTYTYVYELEGCSDSIDVYIYGLYVGPDRTVCENDSLLYMIYEGDWTGAGTYIDSINAYDISDLGVGEYYYEMTDGVCTDEFYLDIVAVEVDIEEELFFCHEDEWFSLDDYISYDPSDGDFVGAGIRDTMGGWYFNPAVAGPGMHSAAYEALGCSYDIQIEVEAFADIPEYEFCERSAALTLTADPPGGTWSGPGFLDEISGLFDPQSLGAGEYQITYIAPNGCETLDTIEIFLYEAVNISPIDQQFCFIDTSISFTVNPPGGTLTINGDTTSPSFNPADLGTGNHEILYSRGTGECSSSQRIFFSVLPPISGEAMAGPDSICPGQNSVLDIQTSGGFGTLTPVWDQGLGFGNSHIVNPTTTTLYSVQVSDGCSEALRDTVEVYVYPEFDIDVNTGPEVCYDDTTFAEIIPPLPGQYTMVWDGDPNITGPSISGPPGIYPVEITEVFSGCEQEFDIVLPGARPLRAHFSVIPNQECIDIIENEVEIINLANGYSNGWMDFGDGTDSLSLNEGILTHAYADSGRFKITQYIENELGCRDSTSRWICVENKVRLYIPNVFTPNNDGHNDELQISAFGISDVSWQIYDRYGALIFEGHSLLDTWDGIYNGKLVRPGVFVCRVEYRDSGSGERGVEWGSVTLSY